MKQQDEKAWEELMGTPLSESALKIDMGIPVSVDEKQAISDMWPDEARIDIISQNGATGDHYAHVVNIGGKNQGKTHGRKVTHTRNGG